MGYNVYYQKGFPLTKKPTKALAKHILDFSQTRHYRRNIVDYGLEGELFIDPKDKLFNQYEEDIKTNYQNLAFEPEEYNRLLFEKYHIIDYNNPPITQPSLYCQWIVSKDRKEIVWDEGEKFYGGPQWLQYIINLFLVPFDIGIKDGTLVRFFDESDDHPDSYYKDKNPIWTQDTKSFWNGYILVQDNIVTVKTRT